jgi:hypothetical protein
MMSARDDVPSVAGNIRGRFLEKNEVSKLRLAVSVERNKGKGQW